MIEDDILLSKLFARQIDLLEKVVRELRIQPKEEDAMRAGQRTWWLTLSRRRFEFAKTCLLARAVLKVAYMVALSAEPTPLVVAFSAVHTCTYMPGQGEPEP